MKAMRVVAGLVAVAVVAVLAYVAVGGSGTSSDGGDDTTPALAPTPTPQPGASEPPEPSLGSMIGESRNYMLTDSWLMTIPGVTIALLVIGMNLIGDGLRDIFDPRARRF